jgi:serine/threonine protein phosphatase 1
MPPRTIAIGDIHGWSTALVALLNAIKLQPDDLLIPLGDYVDRGIDSKGVLDELIAIKTKCRLVPILGNHDQMMLHAKESRSDFRFWLNCGGDSALDSYGSTSRLDLIPSSHFQFLKDCYSYFETDTHVFLHANYRPQVPIEKLDDHTIRWLSLRDYLPTERHLSGKAVVVGHTPQSEVLDLGHLICLDTGAGSGGWLTAMEVTTKQVWQADEGGKLREPCLTNCSTTEQPLYPLKTLAFIRHSFRNERPFELLAKWRAFEAAAGLRSDELIGQFDEEIDALGSSLLFDYFRTGVPKEIEEQIEALAFKSQEFLDYLIEIGELETGNDL